MALVLSCSSVVLVVVVLVLVLSCPSAVLVLVLSCSSVVLVVVVLVLVAVAGFFGYSAYTSEILLVDHFSIAC